MGTRSLPRIFEVFRQLFRLDKKDCMPMTIGIFHMFRKPFEMVGERVQGHRWSAEDFDDNKMKADVDHIFDNAELPWSEDQIFGTNLKLVKTTSPTDDSGFDVALEFFQNYNERSSTAADIRFGTCCNLSPFPFPKNSEGNSGLGSSSSNSESSSYGKILSVSYFHAFSWTSECIASTSSYISHGIFSVFMAWNSIFIFYR
jgi:hypothetical protein